MRTGGLQPAVSSTDMFAGNQWPLTGYFEADEYLAGFPSISTSSRLGYSLGDFLSLAFILRECSGGGSEAMNSRGHQPDARS